MILHRTCSASWRLRVHQSGLGSRPWCSQPTWGELPSLSSPGFPFVQSFNSINPIEFPQPTCSWIHVSWGIRLVNPNSKKDTVQTNHSLLSTIHSLQSKFINVRITAISPHAFRDCLSLTSTQLRSLETDTHFCLQEPSVNLLDQEHPEKYQNSDVLLLQQAILPILQLLCNHVHTNYK